MQAAASGSQCRHTPTTPVQPAHALCDPGLPAWRATPGAARDCETRGWGLGSGESWLHGTQQFWCQLHPCGHRTKLTWGSTHLRPSYMQLVFGVVACPICALCSRSTASRHEPYNASCEWAVALTSVPSVHGAITNRCSSVSRVAGILLCGQALGGAPATSSPMHQSIISTTPLELQAGV